MGTDLAKINGRHRLTVHPQWGIRTRVLARTLQAAAGRVTSLDPLRARALLDALGKLAPPVRAVKRQRTLLGGVPCEWYVPAGAPESPVIVHFHGGGYALCSNSTHRLMISDIAAATGARCVGADYRLAPEHPFPAGLDDCVAVIEGLVDEGFEASDLILSGDSAGAALAMGALLRLRDGGHPLPRAAILLSPWPDLRCEGDTIEGHAAFDYLSGPVMHFFAGLYLQGTAPEDVHASPARADLSGLPPMLIHAGGAELLLADIRALAEQLEASGVEVKLEVWEGMIHAWHGFTLFLPEARQALASVGRYVRELPDHGAGPGAALDRMLDAHAGADS